jgi:hypothetical protein
MKILLLVLCIFFYFFRNIHYFIYRVCAPKYIIFFFYPILFLENWFSYALGKIKKKKSFLRFYCQYIYNNLEDGERRDTRKDGED